MRSGAFVVAWTGYVADDPDGFGVSARMFDAAGRPMGAEQPVTRE